MDFLIASARAAEPAPQGGGLMSLLPLIILFVAFWFLMIRPQMKKAKEHRQMVESLSRGDEVATNGGLVGKVVDLGDNFILLEVAKGVQVKVQRFAVSAVLPKGTIKTL